MPCCPPPTIYQEKGNIAVDSVKDYLIGKGVDTSKIYSLVLDMDSLDNVKQFASTYKSLGLGDISILINNAGCMAIPTRELTIDGNERQFQSNHLGHFVLTAELFPYFSRDGTKVINVSSSASNVPGPKGLDMDNLNSEKSYTAWGTYGNTKLANVLFTNELQKKANDAGLGWFTTVSLHPGVVNTDLWRYIVGEERLAKIKSQDTPSLESLALSATSLFTLSPELGANTQIYLAATDDDLVKGAFYEEMKEKTNMPSFSKDEVKASELWKISEELAGITFDLTMSVDDAETDEIVVDSDVEESSITDAQKRFFGQDVDDS